MVQIEIKEVLDFVEEIVLLVDVVFIGFFDLGNNIGYLIINGKMDVELDDVIVCIYKVMVVVGKKCGIFCISGEQVKKYVDMGFYMINVVMDFMVFQVIMVDVFVVVQGKV